MLKKGAPRGSPKLVPIQVKPDGFAGLFDDDEGGGEQDEKTTTETALDRAESRALKKAFNEMDTDGSGSLDAGELREALGRLGQRYSKEQCTSMLEAATPALEGELTVEEFTAICDRDTSSASGGPSALSFLRGLHVKAAAEGIAANLPPPPKSRPRTTTAEAAAAAAAAAAEVDVENMEARALARSEVFKTMRRDSQIRRSKAAESNALLEKASLTRNAPSVSRLSQADIAAFRASFYSIIAQTPAAIAAAQAPAHPAPTAAAATAAAAAATAAATATGDEWAAEAPEPVPTLPTVSDAGLPVSETTPPPVVLTKDSVITKGCLAAALKERDVKHASKRAAELLSKVDQKS